MADRPTPFDGLEELFDRLSRQLETATRTWESELEDRSRLDLSMGGASTRLDLADAGDEFVVTVDVPGYGSGDLDVRLRGETLAVRGERERTVEEREGIDAGADRGERAESDGRSLESEREGQSGDAGAEAGPGGTYIRRERETQSFSRQVRLPEPVDADGVTATVNNGVLTVRLPKLDQGGETRRIDVE